MLNALSPYGLLEEELNHVSPGVGTPLYRAALRDASNIVQVLVDAGADPDVKVGVGSGRRCG